MRDCWVDMGVMEASHRPIPTNIDERFLSVYGHAIANVDHMGQMAARIPGGSAASLEAQLFGAVQGAVAPVTSCDRLVGGAVVEGIGVSAGIVEGTVHIVEDLDSDFPMHLSDVVMVCRVTDPSWASLLPLTVAVVTTRAAT